MSAKISFSKGGVSGKKMGGNQRVAEGSQKHVRFETPVQPNIPSGGSAFPPEPDLVNELQSDDQPLNQTEEQFMNTFFKEKPTMLKRVLAETKDVVLVGALFVLVNIPGVESLIIRFFPLAGGSTYIMLCLKAILLMLLYFILKNFYLSRKNKD
jgi:hypothetical protein